MTRQGKFKIQGIIIPKMPEKKVSSRAKTVFTPRQNWKRKRRKKLEQH